MSRPAGALLALLLASQLAGCRAATPAPVAAPPAEAPPAEAAPALPAAIHWVRNSAEHRAVLVQTYRWAGERLAEKVRDLEPGTWAVALDADETVIDNSENSREDFLTGQGYSRERFAAWAARRAAPPVPGVLAFLDRVRELGGRIAIVTNRWHEMCADTEANLRDFAIPFDVVLCREAERSKEPRWERVENGTAAPGLGPLEIVMWVGDNIHDFPGLDQELRHADEAAFERFGVDWVVVPNPMYGSWRRNPPD